MSVDSQNELISTGVEGLDLVLRGGLLKGAVYIVHGPPGAGKTILANQMCFTHAARGGQGAYVTLLAESHTRMLAHMRRMTFFDPQVIPERLSFISGYKVLERDGLKGLLRTLREAISSRRVSLLVLDGFASAEEASDSPKDLKEFIHELQTIAAMVACTVLLLSSNHPPVTYRPEHTMVDGIIELSDELSHLRPLRHVRARKMRGVDQVRGQHTLEITDRGVVVRPRIETQLNGVADHEEVAWAGDRLAFGIPQLDGMLGGGLPARSVTMALGPSGVGKTILGLHFLAEGARHGEPGAYFGFFERPKALVEKAKRLQIPLDAFHAQGLLDITWQAPVESIVDVLADRLLTAIQRKGIRRLCIDSVNGFQTAGDDYPDRISEVFTAITDELERRGVTTLYTAESQDLFGLNIQAPVTGLSGVTQNMLLLRHIETQAQFRRLISILKLRDCAHDPSAREFRIIESGIVVADNADSAKEVLAHASPTQGNLVGTPRESSELAVNVNGPQRSA